MAFRWLRDPGSDRVALVLGAFDPPTRAHLAVAEAAARHTGLPAAFCVTRVLLDRPEDVLLPRRERVRLLDVLAAGRGWGLAECDEGTYLGVRRAAAAAGVEPVLVVGSDKLPQLSDPSFYPDGRAGVDATFRECRFVVVPRAGSPVDRPDVEVLNPGDVFADAGTGKVSSTEVRARVARGEPVEDLVPPVVALALAGYTGFPGPR